MVSKYIDVDGYWGIIMNYDFDLDDYSDYHDIAAVLSSFGLSERNIAKSLRILKNPNTGMAVSNDDLRMTTIYVANTTSNDEFWSTVNHELFHAEQAILDYYGTDWQGEPAAYLAGYLLQQVVCKIAIPCKK